MNRQSPPGSRHPCLATWRHAHGGGPGSGPCGGGRPGDADRGVRPGPAGRREPAYRVLVCAPTPQVDGDAFTLIAPHGLRGAAGGRHDRRARCSEAAAPLAARSSTRCARRRHAGHPDRLHLRGRVHPGRRRAARRPRAPPPTGPRPTDLARMFPQVDVKPDVLYVDNGQILTSAGAAAGLDLCLHLVGATSARRSPPPRPGCRWCRWSGRAGRRSSSRTPAPSVPGSSLLDPVLSWIEDNLAQEVTLADMARHQGIQIHRLLRSSAPRISDCARAVVEELPDLRRAFVHRLLQKEVANRSAAASPNCSGASCKRSL